MLSRLRSFFGQTRVPDPTSVPPAFDGRHSQDFWTNRDNESSSAEAYWNHRTTPLKNAVAQAVAELPGESLLEVGVHAGPTLWAIAQKKHFARLAGTELSLPVLEFARKQLPESLGRPVELVQASADALPYPDKSFDIVVTAGVLLCIGPDAIEKSLEELVRVCRGHLLLAEPYSDSVAEASPEGRLDPYPNTSYWIRNYPPLLAKTTDLISYVHLPDGVRQGHMDGIAVLKIL